MNKKLFSILITLLLVFPILGAVTVNVNGTNHTIPETGEQGWGQNVTTWIQDISADTLQKKGGTFTLTADIDFGASFGVESGFFRSGTANPATAGFIRLANTDLVTWRNGANSDNISLGVSSDLLQFGGINLVDISTAQTLTNKSIDGDDNTVTDLSNSAIKAAAGIEVNKLEALTADRVPVLDGSGFLSASSVTATTLGYVDFTSSGQTQLDSKASSTDLSNHAADTTTHGVTGDIVGTTDTQTLTNKTIEDAALDEPVINRAFFNEQALSPSTPATGLALFYSKDDGYPYYLNDAGTETNLVTHGLSGSLVGTSDSQTLTNKTLTSPVINTGVSGTAILDDDTMATASDTTIPTSESVKAYVDSSAAGDKGLVSTEIFTSGGTYTKDADLRMIRVIVIAGGGGGGGADGQGASNASAGSGGGGGGACIKVIDNASVGATETVTIGAAGTAGASTGGNGGSGGTSSFGAHCSASGGGGGIGDASGTGAINARNGGTAGGSGSSGDLNLAGGNGGWGLRIGSESTGVGGIGGNSALGYGGGGIAGRAASGTDAGSAGSGYGAGGGGGATGGTTGNAAGGAGTAGIVIVEEYK